MFLLFYCCLSLINSPVILFIVLLFLSPTVSRSCWQAELWRPGQKFAASSQGSAGLPTSAAGGLGEVLDLEPGQLGSAGGPAFKVDSPGFWPFQLSKCVSPGGFLKSRLRTCSTMPPALRSSGKWGGGEGYHQGKKG